MRPMSVLATVTGRDRPGVTAAFFAALAAHDVDVRDVEQVVIRDRLILTVLFDLRGDSAPLRNSVTRAAGALGMECEVAVAHDGESARPQLPGERSEVIVLGRPLRPGALSHIAQRIADLGSNIETVTQLSSEPASALELLVRTESPAELRAALVEAAEDTGVDIGVESVRLRRRAKRLVILDLDSTLIHPDAGEDSVIPFSARPFVQTLRRLGYYVGVVSNGSPALTDRFVAELGLDFAEHTGPADALRRVADKFGLDLSQTVAVGSGAQDIELLQTAGLAIACNARGALRAAADDPSAALSHLETVLFVLGSDPSAS
jgi:phosphoserine phosphatase